MSEWKDVTIAAGSQGSDYAIAEPDSPTIKSIAKNSATMDILERFDKTPLSWFHVKTILVAGMG